MFHPNRRYGDPAVLRAYTAGMPIQAIARQLHRHPRTIHDWMTGKRRLPWWVPELLMIRQQLAFYELRHMGIKPGPRAAQRGQQTKTPITRSTRSANDRAPLHVVGRD